jgi:hypothetical protein
MNINDILTEIEYTKERSAKELFEFVMQKEKELREWSGSSKAETYSELDKGLPKKFMFELTPFAYYANTYYGNKPEIRFKPCCGSEQYDGIIFDDNKEIFVEIITAIDGRKRGLQMELLINQGWAPWEHNIHGVEGNKTKRNRSASDIITSIDSPSPKETICKAKELVKKAANEKCQKSVDPKQPYEENKTILIITFDDTVLFIESDRNDFVNFKQAEIDSMEHNFIKIILFGWVSKKFIPEEN